VRRDATVPEAEVRVPLRADERRPATAAWGAWDVVLRDAADAADLRRALAVADVGKLADLAPGDPAPDAPCQLPEHRPAPPARLVAAELCIPDAVRSAARSSVVREPAVPPVALPDGLPPAVPAALQTRKSLAVPTQAEPPPEAVSPAVAAQQLGKRQLTAEPQASPLEPPRQAALSRPPETRLELRASPRWAELQAWLRVERLQAWLLPMLVPQFAPPDAPAPPIPSAA